MQRKLILLSILSLTAFFFAEYLLHDYILVYYPDVFFKVSGFIIVVGIFILFNILFRVLLKQNPHTTIANLVAIGTLIVFISELIFQSFRQTTFTGFTPAERTRSFLLPFLGVTILSMLIAFGEAMDIKYKQRWLNFVILATYFIILFILDKYLNLSSLKF